MREQICLEIPAAMKLHFQRLYMGRRVCQRLKSCPEQLPATKTHGGLVIVLKL